MCTANLADMYWSLTETSMTAVGQRLGTFYCQLQIGQQLLQIKPQIMQRVYKQGQ